MRLRAAPAILFLVTFALVLYGAWHCSYLRSILGFVSPHDELFRAFNGIRPSWGRLSSLAYAPRELSGKLTRPTREQIRVARRVARNTNTESAQDLATKALLDLFSGEPRIASERLTQALAMDPGDAILLSDLAAILLARYQYSGDPRHALAALMYTDRALATNPLLAEGLFNLASILEMLSLPRQARAAWHQYLNVDRSGSGWVQEARQHLKELRQPAEAGLWNNERIILEREALEGNLMKVALTVSRFPELSRGEAENRLLHDWAMAQVAGDQKEAERQLSITREIGRQLRLRGDSMVSDSVVIIEGFARRRSGLASELAVAFLKYNDGLKLYNAGQFIEAAYSLDFARRLLAEKGVPFQFWAGFYLAACRYQHADYQSALERLEAILRVTNSSRYRALEGRCLRLIGLIHVIRGYPEKSLSSAFKALATFQDIGEAAHVANTHALLASCYRYLGDDGEAWSHLLKALEGARRAGQPIPNINALQSAAQASARLGYASAALRFQSEAVEEAAISQNPLSLSGALRWRAAIHSLKKEFAPGLRDLREAMKVALTIPDASVRTSVVGDIYLIQGSIESEMGSGDSLGSLTRATNIYKQTQYRFLLAEALARRGRESRRLGKLSEAEADFADGIKEMEQQRGRISEDQERLSFFIQAEDLFGEMILLQTEQRQRNDLGCDYAERERARLLLDWALRLPSQVTLAPFPFNPVTCETLTSLLPAGTSIVEFKVLKDRTLFWHLMRGRMTFHQVPIGRAAVKAQVDSMLAVILEAAEEKADAPTNPLYDLLFNELEAEMTPGDTLVMVPDGDLHRVPFAALRNRRTGRYLIQDYSIVVAPSATVYLLSARRWRRFPEPADLKVLAIADPKLGAADFALGRLPAARTEADWILRLFPRSSRLGGSEASKRAFLERAERYDIIHFGGHAIVNEKSPLLARLLLAPSTQAEVSGSLYAWELLQLSLPKTKLVVLSACNTASGMVVGSEGILSLTSPFLARGVPAVIGSLWDVGDKSSEEFFEIFYKNIHAGQDPANALRSAQLILMGSSKSSLRLPRNWSAFVMIGAERELAF